MQNYTSNGVRMERTGWRDAALSARHREWGFHCPCVDLDFLIVEYNIGKPVGLVEYKHNLAHKPNLLHPTYRALRELADIGGLPFLIAFYWPDIWAFRITPVNDDACEVFRSEEVMTEHMFVRRLYQMRRLVLASNLESTLNKILPDSEIAKPADGWPGPT